VLAELHVADLGIVADLDLLLGDGFTVITGETGAGKTLLVEAIELLVGGRADGALVREGARDARVEGRFVGDEPDDETVLGRVVPGDGRSRAYIDGRLATATELSERGRHFVDLHGQHAHQSLLDPAVQRAALDRWAGSTAAGALARYRAARADGHEAEVLLEDLGGDAHARAREVDLLRFQLDEIARAGIDDPGEDVALEAEEALLADAVAVREALGIARDALAEHAMDALGDAVAALATRRPLADVTERIRALQADVDDVARDVRRAAEAVSEDPDRLAGVQARRRELRELERKYGDTLAAVVAYGEDVRRRLGELEGYEARAAALEARVAGARRLEDAAAAELSAARIEAAPGLAAAVEDHLRSLAMTDASLRVAVEPGERTDDGADRVTFLLAANPGEPFRPLARAASGGELSRAMLAVRVVLTAAPPTLVFDEVDAGIGGEAGGAVGHLLATLARRHQVLCVTHLAQVAAYADTHVVVEKAVVEEAGVPDGVDGLRTVARARVLTADERVAELSRMLAGVGESAHARRHASELLAAAHDTAERAAR
jgi:DNA repair protein RecN (Recombination protein N)